MKKSLILILSLWFGLSLNLSAQQIKFELAAPKAMVEKSFGDRLFYDSYHNGLETVSHSEIEENIAEFRKIAPPLLVMVYDSLQPGTRQFELWKNHLKLIDDNDENEITILLVDDRNGLSKDDSSYLKVFEYQGKRYAYNEVDTWYDFSMKGGVIIIGHQVCKLLSTYSNMAGHAGIEEALMFMTQFQLADKNFKAPGRGVRRSFLVEDNDDKTYISEELLGPEASVLAVGISNFFAQILHPSPSSKDEVYEFLKLKDSRYQYRKGGNIKEINESKQDFRELKFTFSNGTTSSILLLSEWMEVPGTAMLYSESVITGLLSLIYDHSFDKEKALDQISFAITEIWENPETRTVLHLINELAEIMEFELAEDLKQADNGLKQVHYSSMFPMAVLDILTHFDLSEEDYNERLKVNKGSGVEKSEAVTEYWNFRIKFLKEVSSDLKASEINLENAMYKAVSFFTKEETLLTEYLIDPDEDRIDIDP